LQLPFYSLRNISSSGPHWSNALILYFPCRYLYILNYISFMLRFILFLKIHVYHCLSLIIVDFILFLYINLYAGAEPETIDKGCPVQRNRIFGSKEILFFIIRPLFFSEPRGCPGAGWRLPWIRPCLYGISPLHHWSIFTVHQGPFGTQWNSKKLE
jgi:hypothetical protein